LRGRGEQRSGCEESPKREAEKGVTSEAEFAPTRREGAHCREHMKNRIIENIRYAYEHGVDRDEIANWQWPY
jgi:phosphoketolase